MVSAHRRSKALGATASPAHCIQCRVVGDGVCVAQLWAPPPPKFTYSAFSYSPEGGSDLLPDKSHSTARLRGEDTGTGQEGPGTHAPARVCAPGHDRGLGLVLEAPRPPPHQSSLRGNGGGVSTEVLTPDLFTPPVQSLGHGGAAGGEAEAWHRSTASVTGEGGVAGQEGRRVSLRCCSPAPPGASRFELCLCPGRKRRGSWGGEWGWLLKKGPGGR